MTFQSKNGFTLLTRLAVNTLSHYFDDPNSITHSKKVNSVAAETMALATEPMDGLDLIIAQAMELKRFKGEVNARLLDVKTEALQPDSALTNTQVEFLEDLRTSRVRALELPVEAHGMLNRALKNQFFKNPKGRTFKEIPRSQFEVAKQIASTWQPTAKEMQRMGLR